MLKNIKMLFKKSSNKQITDIDRATIPKLNIKSLN